MSKRKLGEATLILAGSTVLVNVIQIAKQILCGAWFGATTGILDSYFIPLQVQLLFHGVIVGALGGAFVPQYVARVKEGEGEHADHFLFSMLGFGACVYILFAVAMVVFSVPLMQLAGSGLDRESFNQSVQVFRVLSLNLLFGGVAELIVVVYNARQKYFFPAVTLVGNILISTLYLIAFRNQGVYALVYGQIFGSLFFLLVVGLGCRRWGGFRLRSGLGFLERSFRPFFAMMLPIGASLALAHINVVIDQAVASRLGTGAVSVLGYASRMHDIIIKLFVLSVGGALLPFLSEYVAGRRFQDLRSTLSLGNRMAFLVLAPVAVGIYFFGSEAISVVYQRQLFTATDSRLVGNTWAAYAIGCYFMAATIFYGRALNALQDLRPMLTATVIGIPLNVALDLWLAHLFGVVGIALATPAVYLFYMLYYKRRVNRKLDNLEAREPARAGFWRSWVALGAFTVLCGLLDHYLTPWMELREGATVGDRLRVLALLGAATFSSAGLYALMLYLLRVSEFLEVLGAIPGGRRLKDRYLAASVTRS